MALTPNEYYVRYRLTDTDNTGTSGKTPWLAKSRFKVSGNTDIVIGKITRIVYHHYHTSTRSVNWDIRGEMKFADGSVLYSDITSHKFSADVYKYINTFTDAPTPEQFATWTSIRSAATNSPSTGKLYYRANSKYPLDVYVYFYDARDLVDGAAPPTVSGVTCADTAGLLSRFGNYIQTKSDVVITGQYQLDPDYIYLAAQHTLTLTSASGATLYNVTQKDDATFKVGAISAAGAIGWTYTVLDTAGNSVTKTGCFSVLPYAPPAIAGLSVERYAATTDDMGETTYVAADDGEQVRFSFIGTIAQVAKRNAWRLHVIYGTEGTSEDGGTIVNVQSGSDGGTITYAADRAILEAKISTSSAWWFKVMITDSFVSSSMIAYVDETGAFFNVEEDGVAVGMRSKASETDKRFETAENYVAHFHGGIKGLTNYELKEVPTGGRWLDGKPIYRKTLPVNATSTTAAWNSEEIADFEQLINMWGNLVRTASGNQYPIVFWASTSNYHYVHMDTANGKIVVRTTAALTGHITVEYTKSTDAVRTIWVYSSKGAAVILAEQSNELFDFTHDGAGNVTVTAMADLPFTADADGHIVIG